VAPGFNVIGAKVARWSNLLALCASASLAAACAASGPQTYRADSVRGRVLDADTHQPIQGVNVVAHWSLRWPAGIESHGSGEIVLMEDVTDAQGRFSFPAWGPTPVSAEFPKSATMSEWSPRLVFFKPRYDRVYAFPPYVAHAPNDRSQLLSTSTPEVVEMHKSSGNDLAYDAANGNILNGVKLEGCRWTRIPRMMKTLVAESERMAQRGIGNFLPSKTSLRGMSAPECIDVDRILNGGAQ
jgi:hypothetical protein